MSIKIPASLIFCVILVSDSEGFMIELGWLCALCKAFHNYHNHPSGNVQPSESDITITRKIKESGIVMDIQLVDHLIIVPEGNYFSMGDEGII